MTQLLAFLSKKWCSIIIQSTHTSNFRSNQCISIITKILKNMILSGTNSCSALEISESNSLIQFTLYILLFGRYICSDYTVVQYDNTYLPCVVVRC